jgi:hypothetical protein
MSIWLVHAAQAVASPLGLVAVAGIGAVAIAKHHRSSQAVESGDDSGRGSLCAPTAILAGGLAVSERVRTAAAHVGEWASDVYAEARSEWEERHQQAPTTPESVADRLESVAESAAQAPAEGQASRPQRRTRGANGRFQADTEPPPPPSAG